MDIAGLYSVHWALARPCQGFSCHDSGAGKLQRDGELQEGAVAVVNYVSLKRTEMVSS